MAIDVKVTAEFAIQAGDDTLVLNRTDAEKLFEALGQALGRATPPAFKPAPLGPIVAHLPGLPRQDPPWPPFRPSPFDRVVPQIDKYYLAHQSEN